MSVDGRRIAVGESGVIQLERDPPFLARYKLETRIRNLQVGPSAPRSDALCRLGTSWNILGFTINTDM